MRILYNAHQQQESIILTNYFRYFNFAKFNILKNTLNTRNYITLKV